MTDAETITLTETDASTHIESRGDEWLYELGRAGVDKALIAKGRARVVAASSETDWWEHDGIRVHVMKVTRRVPSHPVIAWAISAMITQ